MLSQEGLLFEEVSLKENQPSEKKMRREKERERERRERNKRKTC